MQVSPIPGTRLRRFGSIRFRSASARHQHQHRAGVHGSRAGGIPRGARSAFKPITPPGVGPRVSGIPDSTSTDRAPKDQEPIIVVAVRLQKLIADAGIASRRAAEAYITAGRVTVNGEVVTTLGTRVDPLTDRVTVDGQLVRAARKLYIALHKPKGYTCTRSDPHAARKVGELLPPEWSGVYPVGRLDRESEGLLFLTNDGEFCLHLTHPRFGIRKKYLVTVAGRAEPRMLERFRKGVVCGDETLKIERGRILAVNPGGSLVEIELAEGRYREVRRLFASEGLEVERLVRTQIGPIKLGELRLGRWRTLTPAELKTLLAP